MSVRHPEILQTLRQRVLLVTITPRQTRIFPALKGFVQEVASQVCLDELLEVQSKHHISDCYSMYIAYNWIYQFKLFISATQMTVWTLLLSWVSRIALHVETCGITMISYLHRLLGLCNSAADLTKYDWHYSRWWPMNDTYNYYGLITMWYIFVLKLNLYKAWQDLAMLWCTIIEYLPTWPFFFVFSSGYIIYYVNDLYLSTPPGIISVLRWYDISLSTTHQNDKFGAIFVNIIESWQWYFIFRYSHTQPVNFYKILSWAANMIFAYQLRPGIPVSHKFPDVNTG